MHHALVAVLLPAQLGAAIPSDSLEAVRRAARDAEARYERLSRSLAPFTWAAPSGSDCDEIVGRFCLRFDSTGTQPAAAEANPVGRAREDAVEAARRYFAVAPRDREAAGPVVRLLVASGRAREAVSAAGAFAVLSGDTLWGHLLTGYALHHSGDSGAAEDEFEAALRFLGERRRREWLDYSWLISRREWNAVRRLPAAARLEYDRRLWIFADPFWLTPGNERWVEHIARRVDAELLSRVPAVAGALPWGDDLEELTLRYGTPTARERMAGGMSMGPAPMVEYTDSAQRAYLPEAALLTGLPGPPEPGAKPLLYSARARAAYALQTVVRVVEPAHQVTRFLDGDVPLLRLDAAFEIPDSAALPVVTLIALDSTFSLRTEARADASLMGDTVHARGTVRAPPGLGVYSVEAYDPVAGVAVRARYALPALEPSEGLVLSDILVAEPFPAEALPGDAADPMLRGLSSLLLPAGDTLGLFAEVYRAAGRTLRVEVALQRAGEPSLLSRLGGWIGRTTGLSAPETDPRVAWSMPVEDTTSAIALNLPLPLDREGLQVVVLRVLDPVSGQVAESRRLIRIRERD